MDYDSTKFAIVDEGSCGDFEIPDTRWPAGGTGTSLSWTTVRTSQLQEVYWFCGYVYGASADTTSFALVPHPTQGGVFVDDAEPREADEIAAYGRLGFGTSGALPCPAGGGVMVWVESDSGEESEEQGGDDSSGPTLGAGDLTFVELTTESNSAFAATVRALRDEYGLAIAVAMSPDGFLCRAGSGQRDALNADARVSRATNEPIDGVPDVSSDDMVPGVPGFTERVWNAIVANSQPGKSRAPARRSMEEKVVEEPAHPIEPPEEVGSRENPPFPEQTSLYMLGDIGVSLIYMESQRTGPCEPPHYPEDWSPQEKNEYYTQTTAGLSALSDLAPVGTRVTFWVPTPDTCSTSVEPIQWLYGAQFWADEAMHQLGYTGGTGFRDHMWQLCNERRSSADTPCDWWYIVFAIDDSCSANGLHDGHFYGGSTSSATGGGPEAIVLNYDGQWATPDDIGAIVAHETCHVFNAADEYRLIPGDNCTYPWGDLRVENGNGWADTTGARCIPPARTCLMDEARAGILCEYTRAQIGWSDSTGDGIPDPIDHPESGVSMVVGDGDSLCVGDYADIKDSAGECVRRLAGSDWSMDRGRMLWDGIGSDGLSRSAGVYSWRRNEGAWHADTLRADTLAPVITTFEVHPIPLAGSGLGNADTLVFRFTDGDSRGGRVRGSAVPGFPDTSVVRFGEDKFLREVGSGEPPILRTYSPHADGLWTVTLRVWDVGDGHETAADSSYFHLHTSDVRPSGGEARNMSLSRGWPNPGGGAISWDLQLPVPTRIEFRVVGVDGRSLRTWPARELPGGITRVMWDGRDERGNRVASGRYYLVVKDGRGGTRSGPVTILR